MSKSKIVIIVACFILVIVLVVYLVLRLRTSEYSEIVNNPNRVSISPAIDTLTPSLGVNTELDSPFDTALFESEKKIEQEERPDIIVTNNTPYANQFFEAYTESVTEGSRGYFRLLIYGKNQHTQQTVEKEVRKWLLSLDIPESSLSKLVIEYRTPSIPMEQQ